ncbi:hypothetical protein [Tenacibaculum caenipelagi]|uniref:Uncharacterized protein n=1 Tax=Tenacibaculum caenipelagi TaxID=1325435 RepID=A0A4R6TIF7_9FLAO|nr:hypothetical protein [Tenacibaculum caenipelagi]TDQ27631.1 hypothetical protein DFQ07_1482 [Tenacibaculum caenipelagi]
MIYLKDKPVGIDFEIQKLQKFLSNKLSDWNIEAYGRAEIVNKEPLIFKKNKDYKNALGLNEKFHGRFFFLDSNLSIEQSKYLTTDLDIVFILNIKKIKPEISHRADEEVKMEILSILKKKVYKSIEILKGQDVLKGFDTKLIDMQPYHFIKFSFKHKYNNNITIF